MRVVLEQEVKQEVCNAAALGAYNAAIASGQGDAEARKEASEGNNFNSFENELNSYEKEAKEGLIKNTYSTKIAVASEQINNTINAYNKASPKEKSTLENQLKQRYKELKTNSFMADDISIKKIEIAAKRLRIKL